MIFVRLRDLAMMARTAPSAMMVAVLLSSCASLPSSGPTGRELQKSVRTAASAPGALPIKIVELTDISSIPTETVDPIPLRNDFDAPPTDMVGPGDVLDIAIYETGAALFAGDVKSITGASSFAPAAQVEKLPPQRIDDNGDIRLPYVGRRHVAGMTIAQVEADIRGAMRGLSQNPQVSVSIIDAVSNSVIVGGEVAKPGRLVLSTNHETVGDAIALAGGYRGEAKDIEVVHERGSVTVEYRLNDVLDGSQRALRVRPGDRIQVIKSPRTFSVLGAPGRVEQIAFSGTSTSLTEALSMAGGANPASGDARAVFVFRFTRNADGTETPVVYHLNTMGAGAYFLSQRFAMRDKDLLYIGNAQANQPSKLIQIVSQLFSPIVTVTSAVQVLKN